jgi:hypothetical protein
VSRYTVTDSTARGIGTIEKEVTVSYAARLIRPGQAAALAGLLLRARRRAAGRADVLGPLPRPSGSAPIRFLPTTMPGDSHPMRFHFHFRTLATLALAAVVLSGCTDSVQAGIFRRRPAPAPAACSGGTCRQYQYQAVHACRPAVAAVPAARPQATPVQAMGAAVTWQAMAATFGTDSPAGFLAWLNATRAAYGLPPVGWDAELATWAAANSAEQARRGLGHFIMGPARRQNSAMGGGIASMWMNSPAHRSALLDPTIRAVAIAWVGGYSTFNAR